jgi:hypothetical protein
MNWAHWIAPPESFLNKKFEWSPGLSAWEELSGSFTVLPGN